MREPEAEQHQREGQQKSDEQSGYCLHEPLRHRFILGHLTLELSGSINREAIDLSA